MTPDEKQLLQSAVDLVWAQDVVTGNALSLIVEHLSKLQSDFDAHTSPASAPPAEIAPTPPAEDAPKSAKEKK